MSYTLVVPQSIQEQIADCDLSIDDEDAFYSTLEVDLKDPESCPGCKKLAAPSLTYVYSVVLTDSTDLNINHVFTVWLTLGPLRDHLYVRQFDHRMDEVSWDTGCEYDDGHDEGEFFGDSNDDPNWNG